MSIQLAGIIPEWTMADRLRKAREVSDLDQTELAQRIDVSRQTISNYESGRVAPRKIVLKQWALATGVPLEWIETGHAPTGNDDGNDASMVKIHFLTVPTLDAVA